MGSWLPYNPDVCRVLNVVATHKKYDLVQFGSSMGPGPYEVQIKAMQHSDHEGRGNIRIIDAKTYDAPARSGLHGVGTPAATCSVNPTALPLHSFNLLKYIPNPRLNC